MRRSFARHACRRSASLALKITTSASVPCIRSIHPSTSGLQLSFPALQPHSQLIASVPSAQRRSFISLLNRNRDSSKPVELEPGWGAILKWVSRINDNVRGQARSSLIRAFNDLFAYKNRYQTPVNSSQANQCYRLVQYILEDPLNEGGKDLTLEDLVAARQALLRPPKDDPSYHLSFSRFLYHEIQKRRAEQIDGAFGDGLSEFAELIEDEHAQPPTATENPDAHDPLPSTKLSTVHDDDFRCFLLALSQYKAASEASEILKPFWHNLMLKDRVYKGSKSLWIIVMRGLASEGKESELRELVTFAEAAGVQYMPAFHEIMTVFYAQRDMLDEAQTWFRKPIYGKWKPTKNTYYEVLKFCTRMQQSRWAKDIFQNLIESNPRKELWDVCFQWAVLFLGKGAQEIKHMFNVMVQNNPNDPVLRPDIDSINSVIRAAVDRYEPLLAERFITLAAELGIRLNAETHILQLEYRLNAEDMSGCKAAYLDIQLVESNADEDVPVVNRYIRALCHTRTQDLEFAKRVVSDLESRSITLEPETVVALSIAFLQQDESRDLADTLSLNVFQFSAGQRESIRGAFIDFILDSANSVERSWHAYMMLHHFFGETSRQDRLRIIEGFFRRRDAEKASQVFEHMRNHFNIDVRPTTDDYVRILELFSVCPSQTGLKRVYALLKMDSNVHPNTKLYNGIMLAFGACGQHSRAVEFWNEIAHSIEGPSYESIEIIFWVCEKMPFGDKTARAIWRNMETMDIEVPIKVFGAYAGAIAGSGVLSDVISLFKSAEASLGYPPDPDSVGIAYNALPGQDLQRSFEFWAKGAFPKQWLHLESYTRDETSQFLQIFRVKRNLRA